MATVTSTGRTGPLEPSLVSGKAIVHGSALPKQASPQGLRKLWSYADGTPSSREVRACAASARRNLDARPPPYERR